MSTCPDMEERLHDLVDGEIDAAGRAEAERHIESCGACRAEVEAVRALRARAAALPRSIEPASDLWTGIRARLPREGRVPAWRRPAALAAAAVLLVAATASVTAVLVRRPAPVPAASNGSGLLVLDERGSVRPGLATREVEYLRASVSLLDELDRQRDRLSPETIRVVEDNLRIIDDALRRSREALEKDPENRRLGDLYAAVYRRKVDLLERANRL